MLSAELSLLFFSLCLSLFPHINSGRARWGGGGGGGGGGEDIIWDDTLHYPQSSAPNLLLAQSFSITPPPQKNFFFFNQHVDKMAGVNLKEQMFSYLFC